MNLKAILAKIKAEGFDALTDDEKAFLADSGNLQKALDESAANARRKAEERAQAAEDAKTAAEAKVRELEEAATQVADKDKPELDRLKAENERLKVKIADMEASAETMKADTVKLTRDAKVNALVAKHKITFLEKGVDGEAMLSVFKSKFTELNPEDLDDDKITTPIVESFRVANEAVLADLSGHGSGGDPNRRLTFKGVTVKNPWKKESFNLTLQGQITKEDPELAKKLKAELAA